MIYVISILLVLAFSVLLSACFDLKNRVAYILSTYVLAFACIIACALIISFFSLLNSIYSFLACQVVFFLIAYLLWFIRGKPVLFGSWQQEIQFPGKEWFRESWGSWKVVWVLTIFVLFVYLLGAWLILVVPPNTNDALTTHLARIGFWLQHGNLLPWSTMNIFTLIYPINANLVMLWSVLFTKSSMFTGFIQWSGALAGFMAIFGISRLLGWQRGPALFSGLIFLSLPEVLLQSTTSQLDLIIATLFTISIYFLFLGVERKSIGAMTVSALAIGIAVGTKQIILFTLPGLILLFFIIWQKFRSGLGKLFLSWMVLTVSFALLLGSYIYIQNFSLFRNPLGEKEILTQQMSGANPAQWRENFALNSARFFFQSLDFTGMPPIFVDNLTSAKAQIMETVFSAVGLDLESSIALNHPQNPFQYSSIPIPQEDRAWYGLLGVLLLLPLSIAQLILGIRTREPYRVGLVILAFTFSLCVILVRPGWTPNQGRYFLIPVILTSPFIASVVRNGKLWKTLDWIITILAIVTMFFTTVSNAGKPIISSSGLQRLIRPTSEKLGQKNKEMIDSLVKYIFPNEKSIFDRDRTGRQIFQSGMSVKPVNFVNQFIPEESSLALGIPSIYPIVPFFGEHYARKLFLVFPPETLLDKSWFQDNQIDFLLLHLTDPKMPKPPNWLILYQTSGEWALYYPEWNVPSTP
jgi:hypothetical protein